MIIEIIVGAVVGIIQTILDAVLPAGGGGLGFSIPTGLLTGYSWLDPMAPVHEMVQVMVVYIAVIAVTFAFRLVLTIRHTVLP